VTRYWALWLAGLANEVLSGSQHALLPGRRIDDAIELVHDQMMEGILEGKDLSLIQTDFFKAYDYVNRDALLETLEGMGAPYQIRNLAKKIMITSEVMMPSLDSSPEVLIESRTGVHQGCPISPLFYIIIVDILVKSLEKSDEVKNTEAYMDNLGMLMDSPNRLPAVGEMFEQFGKATGALLNYKKCFVLSPNRTFIPEGRWNEMKEGNYRGWETTYLGVPISLRIDPESDWKKVIARMTEVAARIWKLKLWGATKIRAVNTFVLPIMTFMGRFKIMSRQVAKKMWKAIRGALGAGATT
jgi:hypothetical protein